MTTDSLPGKSRLGVIWSAQARLRNVGEISVCYGSASVPLAQDNSEICLCAFAKLLWDDIPMSAARSREEFVSRMREALGEEVSSPPGADQVRRYFRSLNGRTQDAIDAYEGYASLFYVHVTQTSSSNTSVTYDGGSSDRFCDGWEQDILTRPLHEERHIVDCEGYSVMAVELLTEAGFRLANYMVAIPLNARIEDGAYTGGILHVIAALEASDGRRVFVGNERIHDSAVGAAMGLTSWSAIDETNVRFGFGDTVREAAYDAYEMIMERQEDVSHVDRVAPLRPRRRISPQIRNP